MMERRPNKRTQPPMVGPYPEQPERKPSVSVFEKGWAWANGKKFWAGLLIGAAGLAVGGAAGLYLTTAGTGIMTVGAGHKIIKAKKGSEESFWIELLNQFFGLIIEAVRKWAERRKS